MADDGGAVPSQSILRTDGLGVRYLTRRLPALRDVSLAIAAGERVLLAGPSGGGKSTLALCLTGLIPHSVDADLAGTVYVAGTATVAVAPGALAARPDVQRRLRAAAEADTDRTPGTRVVIEARDLWQRYTGPAGGYVALRGVSLRVRVGEIVAVVGANGSGKTTLLRALSALTRLERGSVTVVGVDLARAGPRHAAGLVAHVFQNPESGFVAATVADEIAYGPRALGWSDAEVTRHVEASLARFGLTALARAHPFTLSQGQKRRLSVAVALVLGPRALLLDEPTFGQDRRSASALMERVTVLRDQGLAVVIATHDSGLVAETADRVVALAGGAVLFDGPPRAFLADDGLLAATGQERPALARILAAARRHGADVPPLVRWRDLAAPVEEDRRDALQLL